MLKNLFNKSAQPARSMEELERISRLLSHGLSLDIVSDVESIIGGAENINVTPHVTKAMYIGQQPLMRPLLHVAIVQHSYTVLQWLIDNGADLEARCNLMSATALCVAAEHNNKQAVEMLLAAGADPYGQTATHSPISALDYARRHADQSVAKMIEAAQIEKTMPKTIHIERVEFRKKT